jgi:hypothetical protein
MKQMRPRRYTRNPDAVSTGLSTAQTVGIVAAGAAALGIVGYFIWKSQQPAAATPTLTQQLLASGAAHYDPTTGQLLYRGDSAVLNPATGQPYTYVPGQTAAPLTPDTTSLLTPAQIAANPGINPATNLPWGETLSQVQAAYVAAHPGSYVNAQGVLVDPTVPQPG